MLSDHQLFKSPIAIDLKAVKRIPTPKAFVEEVKDATVEVLPLVDNIRRFDSVINDYARGWCTYFYEFANVPEVEFFCGGVNEKTPRASAVWRQGNLLHLGFEQTPKEMNDAGRAMLVNSIVYISRFTDDRPIDETPSVFGPEKIALSRRRAWTYFFHDQYQLEWATNVFSPEALASFKWRDRATAKAWFESAQPWLHPGPGNLLEIDVEVKALGTPFDSADFFPKTIAALRAEKLRTAASSALARYAPEGPGANAGAEQWEKWWQANSPYLFYSELGCYRWYVDPLAKKRGVPTKDLRGPLRADAR